MFRDVAAFPTELDALDLKLLGNICADYNAAVETGITPEVTLGETQGSLLAILQGRTAGLREYLAFGSQLLGIRSLPAPFPRLLVVPDARFHAEARAVGTEDAVLVASGLMDALSFLVEIDVVAAAVSRGGDSLAEQLVAWVQQPGLTLLARYFDAPFKLPNLRRFFNDDMNLTEFTLLSSAELFVLLHEVGHIKLGHTSGRQRSEADEIEADRYAYECLLQGGDRALRGAFHMLTVLGLQENLGGHLRLGAPAIRVRLSALAEHAQARGEAVESLLDAVVAVGAYRPDPSAQRNVREALRQKPIDALLADLLWGCEAAARELGIELDEPRSIDRTMDEEARRHAESVAASQALSEPAPAEAQAGWRAFRALPREWPERMSFIQQNPVVLSPSCLRHALLHAKHSEESGAENAHILMEDFLLLEQCAKVGAQQALPMVEAIVEAAMAESPEELATALRAQPHVLTASGERRATEMYEFALEKQEFGIAAGVSTVRAIIRIAQRSSLGQALESLSSAPQTPWQVVQLDLELHAAQLNKDVARQVAVCQRAVELAQRMPELPSWSLRFHQALAALPPL